MAKRNHLLKLLEEKKKRDQASKLASVAAAAQAAQAAQAVPAFPNSSANDDGDITGNEGGYKTPPSNGSRLPGSPNGPQPPSPAPTSPASTFPGEPEAVGGEKPIESTMASLSRPVATPSRALENETNQGQEESSEYYLHESQDAQVWSVKKSRKTQPPHPEDNDDIFASEDPYAATLLDTASRDESDEPRLYIHIGFISSVYPVVAVSGWSLHQFCPHIIATAQDDLDDNIDDLELTSFFSGTPIEPPNIDSWWYIGKHVAVGLARTGE